MAGDPARLLSREGKIKGGRKFALSKAHSRLAQAAMGKRGTVINELWAERGITRTSLSCSMGPNGEFRAFMRFYPFVRGVGEARPCAIGPEDHLRFFRALFCPVIRK